MTAPDLLRKRLLSLVEKTKSGADVPSAGWWDGETAEGRRVQDDAAAGRLHWQSAHEEALAGLMALDAGRIDEAVGCAWRSTDFYVFVLEKRSRDQDMAFLGRPSKRRGRPKGARSTKGRKTSN
jgi:hypothetical protein